MLAKEEVTLEKAADHGQYVYVPVYTKRGPFASPICPNPSPRQDFEISLPRRLTFPEGTGK
jgi:hypothetical protein